MSEKEINLKALVDRLEILESLFSSTLRLASETIAIATKNNSKYERMYKDIMAKLDSKLQERLHGTQ